MIKLTNILNELEINNPRINISAELEEYQEEKYIMYFINFEEFGYEFIGYCEEYRNYHDVRIVYEPTVHNDYEKVIDKLINSPKYNFIESKKMDDEGVIYFYIPLDKIRFKPSESPKELIKND